MPLLLDHSIVGQSATTLTVRRDRNLAACRLCGDLFQPVWFIEASDHDFARNPEKKFLGELEIIAWRTKHNERHTAREHLALAHSGLMFTPEATIKLAPFGLVPIQDAEVGEIAQALREAPRAPVDDVDTTLKGWR